MREVLETKRESEYFSRDGLRTLTGLSESKWRFAILKELLDNALDAINELEDKKITIEYDKSKFAIYDSGAGISKKVLDKIYNFSLYISNKRDFRTPTRGSQGNALKTIIAICYLEDLELHFISRGNKIRYVLNELKKQAGIIKFDKNIEETEIKQNGISIENFIVESDIFDENIEEIDKTIWNYYLCNPDVTFSINGKEYPAIVNPIKRTDKTFIHWYDLGAFNQLIQKVYMKDKKRTVKDFCLKFSGTQRILSNLDFPHKKLADFVNDEKVIKNLYKELKEKTKKPSPKILKNLITTEESLLKIYGNEGEHKYKVIYGEFEDNDAVIPYIIEGFLLNNKNKISNVKIMTAINNSVPYADVPFYFDKDECYNFCGEKYYASNLDSILASSGFKEAKGIVIYYNFLSPYIKFTDKAKTNIVIN